MYLVDIPLQNYTAQTDTTDNDTLKITTFSYYAYSFIGRLNTATQK